MNPIEALIHQLQGDAQLNPGATSSDLDSLQKLVATDLPDDVRMFYSLANGMPDLTYDSHQVSFWSIGKIGAEVAKCADRQLGFADFLIDSWRFTFQPSARGIVVATDNVELGSPPEEIGTLSEFADLYLHNPTQLRIL